MKTVYLDNAATTPLRQEVILETLHQRIVLVEKQDLISS